jgi:hypothetical protein
METGTKKTVESKGLKFDLEALDEHTLIYNEKEKKYEKRQLGIVITDVPDNDFGIKPGIKMLLARD